eukprot:gnl/TRDRNA2_/TRDRNA2_170658_c0_seq1.p1 gnl/TRDRNA2_/TRDRNA2_170658_c0~~gnl/TRDRNA2_/TRDRNA2_170658_c0_seq1.p1  ORF type:complete len:316 (-),score=37.67 gnl/TRDRNA2_/TRDRNA2_170658_c0_seq1:452-1399(-)
MMQPNATRRDDDAEQAGEYLPPAAGSGGSLSFFPPLAVVPPSSFTVVPPSSLVEVSQAGASQACRGSFAAAERNVPLLPGRSSTQAVRDAIMPPAPAGAVANRAGQGAGDSWIAQVFRYIVWLRRNSDEFLLSLANRACPCCLMDVDGPVPRCWLGNPLYWLCLVLCAICMCLGHAFHTLWCQGDEVRMVGSQYPEMDIERKIRIHWVYTYSGGFVLTLILDGYSAVRYMWSHDGSLPDHQPFQEQLGYLLALCISLSYLLGNVNFLHQMKTRSTMLMRASALAKINYGFAFVVVYVRGILRQEDLEWKTATSVI